MINSMSLFTCPAAPLHVGELSPKSYREVEVAAFTPNIEVLPPAVYEEDGFTQAVIVKLPLANLKALLLVP